tara:strand:- start:554 stop:739 length:186 start_codon:yes stop_codon:yes gene_type:complete
MCFGGGDSADDIYKKQKPEFGELPDLGTDQSDAIKRKSGMKDVMRAGSKQRSLFNPSQSEY